MMLRQMIGVWSSPKRYLSLVAALALFAIAWAAFYPTFTARSAPAEQPPGQFMDQGTGVVFQVHPTFIKYPEKRIRDHGIWFVGAGLAADQEVKVRMVWGIEGVETDITSVLDVGFDEDRGGLFANVHGAFAVAFERGLRGAESDFLFYGEWTPVSFRLHDAITGDLLAVAPAVFCGPELEEPWCNYASDIVPIE